MKRPTKKKVILLMMIVKILAMTGKQKKSEERFTGTIMPGEAVENVKSKTIDLKATLRKPFCHVHFLKVLN